MDVTYTEWRSENRLLLAGHREFATVVAMYDVAARTCTELWSSHENHHRRSLRHGRRD
jgi:hypothetical protein